MTEQTKSQVETAKFAASLRARCSLFWIVSPEESRLEKFLFEGAASARYVARSWDIAAGFTTLDGKPDRSVGNAEQDPDAALTVIREKRGERGVWIMRDMQTWLNGPTSAITLRRLRNLVQWLPSQPRESAQAIVVISTSADVPAELANHATVINWPLPDRAEIAALLDATIASLPEELQSKAVNGSRDAAIDAAVGLSGEQAQATFARSLVQLKRIDPTVIAAEKKRVIAGEGLLEWVDGLPDGLSAVGGLDNFKAWFTSRATSYSPAARAYGLPSPKGVLLVGVPGCGKTLSVKAAATALGVPLIRLDLGALKSKFVGESEGNLRKALQIIEVVGPCIVWLDEIEKALAGATGEAGDGGVSADALGTILTWMQDRTSQAFVIATANNAEKLPPELLRKGRFDEIFWVDLPNDEERASIVAASLRSHGRANVEIDLQAVADATTSFTGAEIAALVPDALFSAFADDMREIETSDLLSAASVIVPLAKTMDAKIKGLREFWAGRARSATKAMSVTTVTTSGRALDF